jgi:putative SOS response-associated peptidase YedK
MCNAKSVSVKPKLADFLGPKYTLGPFKPYWAVSGFEFPFVPALTADDPHYVRTLQWGLIPSWMRSKEEALQMHAKTLNARSEGIHETASFREAIRNRRCVLLVEGFFEWQHMGKQVQPYFIHMPGKEPFAFGGVWSQWNDPGTGELFETTSIVTTAANELMSRIHNVKKRMPLILDKNVWPMWLDAGTPLPEVDRLMQPYPDGKLEADPVSNLISSRSRDKNVPEVQEPVTLVTQGSLGF